jgi:4-hydroxy-3-methylbut-2-enyl diphosphate reductase IspH
VRSHCDGTTLKQRLATRSLLVAPGVFDMASLRLANTSGFEVNSWVGILAPAQTPRPIVDKLNRELNAVLASPEIAEKLATLGIAATPETPDAFAAQIKADLAKYGKVVKAAGIKAE